MSGAKREQWGSQIDFILSCLGFAVGLGNVWRFPYLCGRNGGAAFLIPYVIMLVFAGLPTFYMELIIGQYGQVTPLMLYRRMCPVFAGLGYTMLITGFIGGITYNVIIAWSIRYLFSSFTSHLPWYDCQNSWNTIYCFDDRFSARCEKLNLTFFNNSCLDTENDLNLHTLVNQTYNISKSNPAEEYLNLQVLGISKGLEDIGTPKWDLVLSLLLAWIIVFACLIKGIKSAGKVVYFTATFPYVLLLILMIRGCTLPGAIDGIKFYLIPKMDRLMEASVWKDAASQIFYSLSLGGAGLVTLASYNKFHNNVFRDTLIVVFGNCLTSIFAGFAIFPILGFMSHVTGKSVEELAASGPGLAFVAYPDAITRIAGSPFWAIMFFFMLVLLGIDSQLVGVEATMTCLTDKWPILRETRYKLMVLTCLSVGSFLLALPVVSPGGPYILTLLDSGVGAWPGIIACLVEICMVAWVYGIPRFVDDIYMMLGRPKTTTQKWIGYPVNWYWKANWMIFSPVLIFSVLIFNWAKYRKTRYGSYIYPDYGEAIGWLIAFFCVMWIPIMAIVMVVMVVRRGKPWSDLIKPNFEWGPPIDEIMPIPKPVEETYPLELKTTRLSHTRAFENIAFNEDVPSGHEYGGTRIQVAPPTNVEAPPPYIDEKY